MKPVIIIAEAGVNHNGSLNVAKQLIEVAAGAGADYVKFQTFKADSLVSKNAIKADYQLQNTKVDKDTSQYGMLKKLELSYDDHVELIKHCNEHQIKFLSTAFDLDSIEMLRGFGISLWKIPSGEITNLPYLRAIGKLREQVILSTGMSTMAEIEEAINVLAGCGTLHENISILHCNTEYPTPYGDVNLTAMLQIGNAFGTQVGYSDHTMGIEVAIAAAGLGARIIEKHFTLDCEMVGPDHRASLEPQQLCKMIEGIRHIEQAIGGSGIKEPSPSELKNISIVRKSIHLNRKLPAMHIIQEEDLQMMRPGDGISPMLLDKVIGKKLAVACNAGHKLTWSELI